MLMLLWRFKMFQIWIQHTDNTNNYLLNFVCLEYAQAAYELTEKLTQLGSISFVEAMIIK